MTAPKNTNRFAPGNPGKPKGAVNHTTRQIREMIEGAREAVGGQTYLEKCARDPKLAGAFLGLVAKVLPVQLTGANGGPLQVQAVEWTVVNPAGEDTT